MLWAYHFFILITQESFLECLSLLQLVSEPRHLQHYQTGTDRDLLITLFCIARLPQLHFCLGVPCSVSSDCLCLTWSLYWQLEDLGNLLKPFGLRSPITHDCLMCSLLCFNKNSLLVFFFF